MNRIVPTRAIIRMMMMIMGAMSFRTRVDDDEESSGLVIEGEPNLRCAVRIREQGWDGEILRAERYN